MITKLYKSDSVRREKGRSTFLNICVIFEEKEEKEENQPLAFLNARVKHSETLGCCQTNTRRV